MAEREGHDCATPLERFASQNSNRRFRISTVNFAAEYPAAKWEEVATDLQAPVVLCDTLLAMKRVAGRPQDLADIAGLEGIQKLKESDPDD